MQVFWVDVVGFIFEIDYSLIGLKSLTIQLVFNKACLSFDLFVTSTLQNSLLTPFSGVFHKLGKVGISDIRGFNK